MTRRQSCIAPQHTQLCARPGRLPSRQSTREQHQRPCGDSCTQLRDAQSSTPKLAQTPPAALQEWTLDPVGNSMAGTPPAFHGQFSVRSNTAAGVSPDASEAACLRAGARHLALLAHTPCTGFGELQCSDKAVLPKSAFRFLARSKCPLPFLFVVRAARPGSAKRPGNAANSARHLPAAAAKDSPRQGQEERGSPVLIGAADFSAPEGTLSMPLHLMQVAGLQEGGLATLTSVPRGTIPTGKLITFRPTSARFPSLLAHLGPQAFLEEALARYTALQAGVPISIQEPDGTSHLLEVESVAASPAAAASARAAVSLFCNPSKRAPRTARGAAARATARALTGVLPSAKRPTERPTSHGHKGRPGPGPAPATQSSADTAVPVPAVSLFGSADLEAAFLAPPPPSQVTLPQLQPPPTATPPHDQPAAHAPLGEGFSRAPDCEVTPPVSAPATALPAPVGQQQPLTVDTRPATATAGDQAQPWLGGSTAEDEGGSPPPRTSQKHGRTLSADLWSGEGGVSAEQVPGHGQWVMSQPDATTSAAGEQEKEEDDRIPSSPPNISNISWLSSTSAAGLRSYSNASRTETPAMGIPVSDGGALRLGASGSAAPTTGHGSTASPGLRPARHFSGQVGFVPHMPLHDGQATLPLQAGSVPETHQEEATVAAFTAAEVQAVLAATGEQGPPAPRHRAVRLGSEGGSDGGPTPPPAEVHETHHATQRTMQAKPPGRAPSPAGRRSPLQARMRGGDTPPTSAGAASPVVFEHRGGGVSAKAEGAARPAEAASRTFRVTGAVTRD